MAYQDDSFEVLVHTYWKNRDIKAKHSYDLSYMEITTKFTYNEASSFEVLNIINEHLQNFPEDPEANIHKCECLLELGNYKDCFENLEHLIGMYPQYVRELTSYKNLFKHHMSLNVNVESEEHIKEWTVKYYKLLQEFDFYKENPSFLGEIHQIVK